MGAGPTWTQPVASQPRLLTTPRATMKLLGVPPARFKCFATRLVRGHQEAPWGLALILRGCHQGELPKCQPRASVRGGPCPRFYALGGPLFQGYPLLLEQGGLWAIDMCPPKALVSPCRNGCRCTGPWNPLLGQPKLPVCARDQGGPGCLWGVWASHGHMGRCLCAAMQAPWGQEGAALPTPQRSRARLQGAQQF